MYKRIFIIIIITGIFLLLLGIALHQFNRKTRASIVGKYESVGPTRIEQVKFALSNIECFYAGRTLNLFPDSTFTMIDSTGRFAGIWHQTANLVEFHIQSTQYYKKEVQQKETANIFTLDYSNPDLYYFLPNSSENCVEIFKIKP